jgi:magnesium chelatase family protein
MLARRLPSIMPPLTTEEAVEVTRLHSLAGQLKTSPPAETEEASSLDLPEEPCLITHPPFRSPHHSASAEGILGGGKTIRPGEISLAHLGTLFLDEAPEFRSNVLQALREPLEDRVITIARAEGQVRLPAEFQLILAANPCPCGRLGSRSGRDCFCSAEEIHRYWRKFGGALLDRVELRVAVTSPDLRDMGPEQEETSAEIARRVQKAVEIQEKRFAGLPIRRNTRMPPALMERFCLPTDAANKALLTGAEKLGFSGRAFHGLLRVARTIADLEGAACIETVHILEAIQHRLQGEDPYDILSPPE